ncbi:MAG: hypothetical protein MJZ38_03210 [archaeon]|nr:hypothetical protein [archaeon]
MSIKQVLADISRIEGVYKVFAVDLSTALRVEIQESPRRMWGYTHENRAREECRNRQFAVCVFSRNFIEEPTEMLSVMTDCTGEIYGHDVPRGMSRDQVKGGAVWVSDSFVVYPELMPKSDLKWVVMPHQMHCIGEEQGVKNVIAFNPSIETDLFLKRRLGYTKHEDATSTIIAMDFL